MGLASNSKCKVLNASHSEVSLSPAPIIDTGSSNGQYQNYKDEHNSSMSEAAGYADAHHLSQALSNGQASAYAQRSPSPRGSIQSPINYPNSYSFVQQHSNGSMLPHQQPKASTHSSWRQKEHGYSLPNGNIHSYGLHASVQENTAGAPYRQGKTSLPNFSCHQIPTAQLQLMSLGSTSTYSSHGDALKSSTDGLAHQRLPSAQRQSLPRVPRNVDILHKKLQQIMQAHQLQSFYDPQKYQAVLQKVSCIDFCDIAARMKIGIELAYDLAPLALYDIVFFCDDSGSMAFEENGEGIDDLRYILSKVSEIATLFDDDGIVVRFMNSNVSGDGICNADDVENLLLKVRFGGITPLGTNFDRKVIKPLVLDQALSSTPMAKPVLAILITDGEPYGETKNTIIHVIRSAKDALARTCYGSGALAIQIAQVGKDAKTQKFLESLDKDPLVGSMIDCTSYYEMEEEEFARKGVILTPDLWLLKMCVGAIDPEYDSKDD